MKLHLLRHGKALQQSDSGRDFDRKLNEKGLLQCQLIGEYLVNKELDCETWCSAAKRTRETFSTVTKKIAINKVVMRDDFYLCSREILLDAIWQRSGNTDLLIIGHNFGISDLATYLTDERIELRTSGYVCIDFDDFKWEEVSRGLGTISHQYRPKVDL
ncbi:MAG: histidine phosphatase family protein [Crocinitomicaceae bacterium]|nr:histidine phosphatase family protein [Flavobacteriales bacterium]NQZ38285.1 histidine phosphatase family protein [Crocinitomicaceae bacterium]